MHGNSNIKFTFNSYFPLTSHNCTTVFHCMISSTDIIPLMKSVKKQLCINFRDTVKVGNVEKLKLGDSA